MAKRNTYTVNSTFYRNGVELGRLTPTSIFETAPGDSLSGRITHKLMTNPVELPFFNDVHFDHFHFYVPYRLVWDQWPSFISDRITSTGEQSELNSRSDNIPMLYADSTVVNRFREFFTAFFVQNFPDIQTVGETNYYGIPALVYLAYLKIRDVYFRPNQFNWDDLTLNPTEGKALGILPDYQSYNALFRALMDPDTDFNGIPNSLDITDQFDTGTGNAANGASRVFVSSSDFHRQMFDINASPSVDITGAETADDLRTAFAQDHFQRVRDYYGDKYTDYLRAAGVSVSPQLIDDPEVLARKSGHLVMNPVDATTPTEEAALGARGGFYTLDLQAPLKKSYASEHGVVMSLSVIRMSMPLVGCTLPLYKTSREEYWTPEFDSVQSRTRRPWLFNVQLDPDAYQPKDGPQWLEYQTGFQVSDAPTSSTTITGELDSSGRMYVPQPLVSSGTDALDILNNLIMPNIGKFSSVGGTNEFADIRTKFSGKRITSVTARQRPLF